MLVNLEVDFYQLFFLFLKLCFLKLYLTFCLLQDLFEVLCLCVEYFLIQLLNFFLLCLLKRSFLIFLNLQHFIYNL